MLVALTREVSPAIARCELTHLTRTPIDVAVARRQHAEYERCLSALGCVVTSIDAGDEMPDSVFIEDTAVVLEEMALVTRPGAVSRRAEVSAVAEMLRMYRRVTSIEPPGTMDGGDVLVVNRRVFVGLSTRTNAAGAEQLSRIAMPFGYAVETITVRECLHLKSAVTAIGDDAVLLDPRWVDAERFAAFEVVEIDPAEPGAANALRVGETLVFPPAFPRTRARLEGRGYTVCGVDVSELAKAEGAVTCCSLVFRA